MRPVFVFVTLFIAVPFILLSQERNDIGIIAGTTYYMGDYNPSSQFYKPSPAVGAIFRRNFNDLYSLRVTTMMGWVKGEHDPNRNFLPGDTPPFSQRVIELDGVAEIGFIHFNTLHDKRRSFTPYAVFGAGIAYINQKIIMTLPVGLGMKYSPINRWALGLEWRFYKTSYDGIDGYINTTSPPRSLIHNNDWFAMAGFFATYRIFKQSALCPAYR